MRTRNEKKRQAARAEYLAGSDLRAALRKGESNRCFANATRAVFAQPDRLVYCEGFIATTYSDGGHFLNHHAWVKDKTTGERHEVTLKGKAGPNDTYIGREFTKDELQYDGEPIEGPEWRTAQLNLRQQLDLLTEHGYEVELHSNLWDDEKREQVDWDGPHDISQIDLTDGAASQHQLNLNHEIDAEKQCEDELAKLCAGGLTREEGLMSILNHFKPPSWEYEWHIKEPEVPEVPEVPETPELPEMEVA